ncbi:YfhE family protein [Psychrobacillus antarcticus]|nr:YfhE family protein [Psychrobacillus antarcticus]
MKERKEPHEKFNTKDNGLTSMQEVTYPKDYKRADKQTFNKNQIKK